MGCSKDEVSKNMEVIATGTGNESGRQINVRNKNVYL